MLGLDGNFSARDLVSRGAVPDAGYTRASQHLASDALVAELRDSLSELRVVEREGARARDLSAEDALEEFDRSLSSQGARLHTAKMYRWAARNFLSAVGKSPGAVTLTDLEAYLQLCGTRQAYSPATLHLLVRALLRLFVSLGLKTASPLRAVRRPSPLPRFLKEDEVRRLLQAYAGAPRAHAIVSLLVYTGLRVSELCALAVPDLDLDGGEILVRSRKGGRDRIAVLNIAS